ncbi:MAG: hypothetical protein R6V01_03015 [Thermoplasmatota archaeon]
MPRGEYRIKNLLGADAGDVRFIVEHLKKGKIELDEKILNVNSCYPVTWYPLHFPRK